MSDVVRRKGLITAIIALLAMIGPFTIDMVYPGFAAIGAELMASPTAMQQVTSVYLLSFAVMSLWHGPVSDAVGRKPVMVTGMIAYALASAVCALAPSLEILLVGRALQGLSAGAAQIISRTVIRDLFRGAAAQRMMANVSMIFGLAPAVAPIVGGWLLGVGPWRSVFWVLVGFGIAMSVLVLVALPETHAPENRTPLRAREVVGGLRMVFSDGRFIRLALASSFAFTAQMTYVMGAPIIVLQLLGRGEQDFWIVFVPLVTGQILGSFLSGRLANAVPQRILASRAFVALVVAGGANVAVTAATGRLPWLMVMPPFIALAMGIVFPVMQLQMLDLFPGRIGAAASGQSFVSLLFNAALSGIVVPLVATSMLNVALTSATAALIGALLWWWHVSRAPRTAAAA